MARNKNLLNSQDCKKIESKKIIKLIEKVKNDFQPTLGIPDALKYESYLKAYKRNM